MNQYLSANSFLHMLRIINKYVSKKKHVCYAPDEPTNQEVNFDVIINVMAFLTLGVKV